MPIIQNRAEITCGWGKIVSKAIMTTTHFPDDFCTVHELFCLYSDKLIDINFFLFCLTPQYIAQTENKQLLEFDF